MLKAIPFTRKISLLFGGELDKVLTSLFNGNQDTFLDELTYGKLVEIIESPKCNKADVFNSLLKYIEKQTEWSKALRTLMILHKLIHNEGSDLLEVFSSDKLKKLFNHVPTLSLRKNEETLIPPNYFNYLQKLVYNYQDLTACFSNEPGVMEKLKKNNLSLLHLMSKVQNMLGYLIKILPFFGMSLAKPKAPNIVKQAAYFCLTDCFYYYGYINHIISTMITQIYSLVQDDAIFLFEIFTEHIQMTKNLKALYGMRVHLGDFYLDVPEFYPPNDKYHSELEVYITTLKTGPLKKRCSIQLTYSDIQLINQPLSSLELRSCQKKSMDDFSKSLIKDVSSFSAIYEKARFMPPKFFLRRKGPFVPPKIKISKPKSKPVEAPRPNSAVKVGDAPNQHLLNVPGNPNVYGPTVPVQNSPGNKGNTVVTPKHSKSLSLGGQVAPMIPLASSPMHGISNSGHTPKAAGGLMVPNLRLAPSPMHGLSKASNGGLIAPSIGLAPSPMHGVTASTQNSKLSGGLMVPGMSLSPSPIHGGFCRSVNHSPNASTTGKFTQATLSVGNLA